MYGFMFIINKHTPLKHAVPTCEYGHVRVADGGKQGACQGGHGQWMKEGMRGTYVRGGTTAPRTEAAGGGGSNDQYRNVSGRNV